MMQVPAEIPVTTPEEKPTVAIAVSLLNQLPPEVVSLKVVVDPTQTCVVPLIGLIANDVIEKRHANIVSVNSLIMTGTFIF